MIKLLIYIIFIFSFSLNFISPSSNVVNTSVNNYQSIVCLEKTTGKVLYGMNEEVPLRIASLTKVLTCLVVLENFDLDSYLLVTNEMLNIEGSKAYLSVGFMKVIDLLHGLMLISGNDCANVFLKSYGNGTTDFISLMNELVIKLNLTSASFINPTGLDETSSNIISALDYAKLFAYALDNKSFRDIASCKKYTCIQHSLDSDIAYTFINKHRLVKKFNDTCGKTGYTRLAGRTLVTSFKGENEIICVTLNTSNDWQIHLNLKNRYLIPSNRAWKNKSLPIINSLSLTEVCCE